MKRGYKEKYGVKEFLPESHNPLPWEVEKRVIWHRIVAANGKVVCNCRNIKDAEFIVSKVNAE